MRKGGVRVWEEKWYHRVNKWALATGVLALVVIGLIVLLINRREETAPVPTLPAYKPALPATPSSGNREKAAKIVVDVKGRSTIRVCTSCQAVHVCRTRCNRQEVRHRQRM